MKWFNVLVLAASLGLAACATPPGSIERADDPSAPRSAAATPAPRPTTPAAPRAVPGDMPPVAVTELNGGRVAATQPPADLWERIRRGFAMPELDADLVRRHEDWYATRPEYIERMVERSRLYLFHIVEELELRQMPTELALLPYIESAFNPQAVSSAKAAGMWQFMPGTGRDFRLTQNVLRDDRRDVLDSTRAALDYLQKLHQMFGDWHLALAAYNWGQGNVKRAIERNQAAGLGTGYLDLSMPAETRNYVPKLQAVKNIIANPQAHRAVLPLIENHPFFDTVDITHDIDLEVAAHLADVRVEDLKALNPSQRKPVIFAAGTPQVLLPWNNAATFKQNLAKADPAALTSWTAWVAPSSLPSREVASRFGMREEDFREVNNVPRGMVIRSGSTVLVRRGNGSSTVVDSAVVNNAQLAYTPEIILRRTTVRARKGDTLASLAARYDLPASTVAGWNPGGARGALKRGQAVVMYLPVRAAAARDSGHASGRRSNSHAAPKASAHAGARGGGDTRGARAPQAAGRAKAAVPAAKRASSGKSDKRSSQR